jgi:hypothetical protein
MKRKIVLLLFIGVAAAVVAQQYSQTQRPQFVPEHDFRFGVGAKPFEASYVTSGESFDFYGSSLFNARDYYSGARYTTNSWFLEYTYQANSWFGVGTTANYLAYYNKYYDGVTDKCIGSNVREHFSLYPTIRLTWLRRNGFTAYSAFGIGPRLILDNNVTDKSDSSGGELNIAGQITFLGFTFGDRMYGFTNLLTLGSQGLLNVGIGYRLTVPQKKK